MFDVPLDAWQTWLGLTAVSVALLGVATGLPTAPPPDAVAAARTVDGVASSPYAAFGEHPLPGVDRVRVTATTLGLAGLGGRSHAPFRFGPVTPARTDRLHGVLVGGSPEAAFGSPAAFAAAARQARAADAEWRAAPDTLRSRHVTWEGVDVTLVG